MLRLTLFACAFMTVFLSNGFSFPEDPSSADSFQNDEDELNDQPYVKRKNSRGCSSRPNVPTNGHLTCTPYSNNCRAVCLEGYQFPNGELALSINCRERRWQIQGTTYTSVPQCEPICLPECKNNGICIGPNQCDCQENFSGAQCQFENKPCLNLPPMVMNAQRKCNSKTCTITCLSRFAFPDGSSVANLACRHGNWEPTRSEWVAIPDCKPVCNPPCENGGVCLALNSCQCPQDLAGPQCQYRTSSCGSEKLGFNGGLSCASLDADSYGCELRCPDGVDFEFPPAKRYVCRYERGEFEPGPVPQCLPPAGTSLVAGERSVSYTKSVNRSWSMSSASFARQLHHHVVVADTYDVFRADSLLVDPEPRPATCFSWSGTHYKTFDGLIYSFESRCAHTLLKETRDGLLSVTVQRSPSCSAPTTASGCPLELRIFVQGKEYTLASGPAGRPELRIGNRTQPLPAQLAHVRVEPVHAGRFVLASLDAVGLRIKWDGRNLVQLDAAESLWNRTAGLCGSMNGRDDDDLAPAANLMRFVDSCRQQDLGEKCEEHASQQHPCGSDAEREREASEFCAQLLSDPRYKSCSKSIDLAGFESTCRWDYCSCGEAERSKCACETMGVYVRQCAHDGLAPLAGWRNSSLCPLECDEGKVYMACGPRSQASCGADLSSRSAASEDEACEEGCFCPEGRVAHEGRCIGREECPCRLRGKLFSPGATVPKDCNTCACAAGKWSCTETKCAGRCSAVGDPHYTTFDGKRYDFMGQCSYYLVKADNFSVEAENTACASAISEMMGFTRSHEEGEPSCTRTVTVRLDGVAIKLKQNHEILVNGEDVTKLPMLAGGARVRIVSSIFIGVELPNGLEVLWDGVSRVYVNAPAHLRGKTKGLCGTFTSNQKNDFLTPDGDVEQSAVAFANKWKTSENCVDVKKNSDHPCDLNPRKRAAAEKYCSVLKKKLFLGCHWHVDPEPFYKDCLYDMCACENSIESCLCPTLSDYAKDCAQLGVIVPWRQDVAECQIHCPGDQEYQICGSSCTRSCADISFHHECKEQCVEGCNCPRGLTLDVNGECVPVGQCPCSHAGLEFLAGYREVRPGTRGSELCTCAGGVWSCRAATSQEKLEYRGVADLVEACSAARHQQLSTCEPLEPVTCRNMHRPEVGQSPAVCRPGCVCKPGYVLDGPSGHCVERTQCPCYHGGRSYGDGHAMQQQCNTCVCNSGKWNCTDIVCPGVCSVWGDSHYETFDDRQFDFEGVCDYVLAKGRLSDVESFDVTIRNVACGTTGVTCSKSVTLTVGQTSDAVEESVTFTRGKSLSDESFNGLGRIVVRRAGLFVFADVPDLGLVVQWDEGTRVYVRLEPRWKGRTRGLCGDFNDDGADDLKTPSGGLPEASAALFADSWKRGELCAEPSAPPDACARRPERKLWAAQSCGRLKAGPFRACHSELAPDPYIDRCIADACACDDGGDCQCLCTAVAAYAHECAARGVPVKWRSQKFCPIQCDESCSTYSACVSTCPLETCDNLMTHTDSLHLCKQDTCVEGCQPKSCPVGQVYSNASHAECVPRADCKTLCKLIDGVEYYEGDRVSGDPCHSCFCSRGKLVCKGEPCAQTTTSLLPTTAPVFVVMGEETKKCTSGWTKWFNRDLPKEKGFRSDIEELPSLIEMLSLDGEAVCEKEKMVDIKCRTADTKISYKDVGLNVECSLENGLLCLPEKKSKQTCPDFEISVMCRCEEGPKAPTIVDECNLSQAYELNKTNCHNYRQCSPGPLGNKWVAKTCGLDMMFNEKLQVCDWPANVAMATPECDSQARVIPSATTITKTENVDFKTDKTEENEIGKSEFCKEGERWDDCAYECNKTCDYYYHVLNKAGICNKTTGCVPGCVPVTRSGCPTTGKFSGYYWRDVHTCVNEWGCSCRSSAGNEVAPGDIVKESHCRSCQCIENFYTCEGSACETINNEIEKIFNTNKTEKIEAYQVIVVPSAMTPPRECDSENDLAWLIEKSPLEVSFAASSNASSPFGADSGKLQRFNSFFTWRPAHDDDKQWLEVRLQHPQPVYGVVVGGDAFEDKFVTSYKLLFSEDGQVFSYVMEGSQPKILRGPADGSTPVQQILHPPIEAKVVRVNPVTWHGGIAMQLELIGCEEGTTTEKPALTTPIVTETVVKPVCDDRMGYLDGLMSDQQVTVSSSATTNSKPNLRLSASEVWRPLFNNPNQYVQFDFLELRNITGIETKGGNGTWTTVYKVFYSSDGKNWNPIMDDNGVEKEFLANVDDNRSKINYFKRPISARLLKIFPIKWHRQIGLKVEVLGCFVPYPQIESPPFVPLPPPSGCNVCPGISVNAADKCLCDGSLLYDGRYCVTKQQCPCVVGYMTYPVGSSFETSDCQHCLCALGGSSVCQPKSCPYCPIPGERPVLNELCTCLCKPCPVGKRLCPTSNDCIDEKLWCNGVQDCPDDESDCSAIAKTDVVKQTIIKVECRTTCPPGFIMVPQTEVEAVGHSYANFNLTIKRTESIKSSFEFKTKIPAPHRNFQSRMGGEEESVCPKFICNPESVQVNHLEEQCHRISCPEGFQPKYDQSRSHRKTSVCDNTCVPVPPKQRVCSVIGRTFTTFDNLQFKYDICNHILARDRDANRWYIVAETTCRRDELSCSTALVMSFDGRAVALYPGMNARLDGREYSAAEVKRLADNDPGMRLSRVGDALRFESRRYPVWALLESSGELKLGVSEELAGHVDGMCGYLDGLSANDQQTPDGRLARSSREFGESWKLLDSPECRLRVCPREAQREAWRVCSFVRDASFDACANAVDREGFVSSCLESSCACLGDANATAEECRCRALSGFVAECLANQRNAELSSWRSVHDCPAVCDPPLVHKDCFRGKCELSCDNLREAEPCPAMEGQCVSGCFCPDGLVRNGERCVAPSECRDCACDGLGGSAYVTFDRTNLPFSANCTYVLSRDIVHDIDVRNSFDRTDRKKHTYQVWVTNGACDATTCTEAITILYESHVVQIRKSNSSNQLVSVIDDRETSDALPYKAAWLSVEKSQSGDLSVVIPAIQLELVTFKSNFAFVLRLSSHTFGQATEGLCGNCNGDRRDDLRKIDGELAESAQEFGESWLVKEAPAGVRLTDEDNCGGPKASRECASTSTTEGWRCEELVGERFSRCHALLDPTPYLLACHDALCSGSDGCADIEAYARMCSLRGECVPWRTERLCPPAPCPPNLVYQPCESGCRRTCENLEEQQGPECAASLAAEACSCPPGLFLLNSTCVLERGCLKCDEQHYDGDVWQQDECTQCTCDRRQLKCQKTVCPAAETVCEQSATPVLLPGTQHDCCPKYLCVSTTTPAPACIETQQPECGFAQTLKVTVDPHGCRKFICQCVPEEECSQLTRETTLENEILEPGYARVVDTSGCCPKTTKVCRPETCPQTPDCPKFHKAAAREDPSSCCPKVKCEPPTDLCIYVMESSSESSYLDNPVAKSIGETWEDGVCKTCTCQYKDGAPTSTCTMKQCIDARDHPDSHDYVVEPIKLESQCCPNVERVACRDGDQVFQVGEKWQPNPADACASTECSMDINGVSKKTIVQECSATCELGYEYRSSPDKTKACCGDCVAVACVVDGLLKRPGEFWYSDDFCTRTSCEIGNGSLELHVSRETCEAVDPLEEKDYKLERLKEWGKCCPTIERTACLSDGKYYLSGESWVSSYDSCITGSCLKVDNDKMMKHVERTTCNTDCPKGWEYRGPQPGNCCGDCRQVKCVMGEFLYEPGETWYSDDNCTSYSCTRSEDQLLISTSTPVCPQLSCSPDLIYYDGCCKKCNVTNESKIDEVVCAVEVLDFEKTIGMVVEKKGKHGLCKNLEPIKGMTECHGHCDSSTHFNTDTWEQIVNCTCCQPIEYRKVTTDLTCKDGKTFTKTLIVPAKCSCENCSSESEKVTQINMSEENPMRKTHKWVG